MLIWFESNTVCQDGILGAKSFSEQVFAKSVLPNTFFRPDKCYMVWANIMQLLYAHIQHYKKHYLENQPDLFRPDVPIKLTIYQYCLLLKKLRQTWSFFWLNIET